MLKTSPLLRWVLFWACMGMHFGAGAQGISLDFVETKFAFGDVQEEKGPVSHVFKFTNTGKGFAQIESVKTTCGCTVSEWTKDSIAAGASGMVKVSFDPQSRPGLFVKEVYVAQKGKNGAQTLTISGKVIPRPKGPKDYYPFEEGAFRFKTNHLTYGSIYKDEVVTLSTIVYNQGSKPIKFIPPKSKVPGHLKPALSKMEVLPGDTATIFVTYHAAQKDDWGFSFDNIFLATTDAAHPVKRINISAELRERFPKSGPEAERPANIKLDKTEVNLGKIEEGQFPEIEFTVSNTGGHPLVLRKVSSGCTCIIPAVAQSVIQPGQSTTIRARFNTRGRIGEQEKEITVICNDPNTHELTLRITGIIQRPASTEGE